MLDITGIYARLAGLGVAILLLLCGAWYCHHLGYQSGSKDVQQVFDQYKAAENQVELAAIAKRNAENQALATAQAETNQIIKKGYSNEITHNNALHSAVLNSLRDTNASGQGRRSATTAQASSATGTNETNAGTWILSDAGLQDLFSLLQRADEVSAQCRALQKFDAGNGLAEVEN
ncbi:hypothetical protein ACO0K2_17040 [Undibacterium sp. MH2W]|uniref:hypothetical protein n=1 Tax=Undibacterium sp. MH2W TaxID=3413044 RepID=UPI003BEFBB0A